MASGAQVRVHGTTYVPLLRPPPPDLEQIPLSFFDAWFLPQPPIQRLFLYDGAGAGGDGLQRPSFPSLVRSLKSSLADAIAIFFPLAGKLTYLPSAGDNAVIIDCSPSAVGAGVAFLEAEASGDARRLSGQARHDFPAFLGLVPSLEASELPAPVLAVQVTRFDGGGLAVGVAKHHAVADGHSFWRFMAAWSAAACGGACPVALTPTFDRSAIVHPMATEMARGILRKLTPELPLLPRANLLRRTPTWVLHETTTLELDRHRIDRLKNHIAEELTGTTARPSTFVAVSALVWSAVVQASSRSLDPGAPTRLLFPGDCRRRLDPPVPEGYFGNCARGCVAEAAAGDLLHGDGGISGASRAIRKAVDAFVARPLAEIDAWFDRVGGLLREPGFVAVAASPRFLPYSAADLGRGAPSRVEFVSGSAHEGMVVVTGGREGGSVQVSACLSPVHVQAFRSRMLGL